MSDALEVIGEDDPERAIASYVRERRDEYLRDLVKRQEREIIRGAYGIRYADDDQDGPEFD